MGLKEQNILLNFKAESLIRSGFYRMRISDANLFHLTDKET
jgi:hypothetical protein